MKLGILRADHLGDMILTTPLARTMARDGWDVTVVGPAAHSAVWENNPLATYQAIEDVCPDWPRGKIRLGRWLSCRGFTHLLVPYYSTPLFVASLFSGIAHRYCQMGRFKGRLTLHHCLRSRILSEPRHMGAVWQDLAEHLGIPAGSPRPDLFLTEREKTEARELLHKRLPGDKPLVIVHPFHKGSTCNLPIETYAEVVKRLGETGTIRICVTGSKEDAARWHSATPGLEVNCAWISCGELTLRQFFGVVAHASVMVVGSTGTLHVASALNVPTVGIFCPHPTVAPVLWRNLVPSSIELSPARDHCKRYHDKSIVDCGFPGGPSPEQVVSAAMSLLPSDMSGANADEETRPPRS